MAPEGTRADGATLPRWRVHHWALLAAAAVLGVVIRLLLLPAEGLRDDTDQFAGWIHTIATEGLTGLYEDNPYGPVTFGPVMAYVWGLLAAVESGFRTATDASDVALRTLMKLPATLADLGLAAGVGFLLRERPGWAVVGAAGILLHPAVWYVSAWWGQYESIYVLAALVAVILAVGGRDGLAAAALAVAISTKPQALPFLVPFAAWFLARGGLLGLGRAAAVGAGVVLVLWVPFLPPGGPFAYLENIASLQEGIFSVLSLRAWNAWWLVQEAGAGGDFVVDRTAVLGPITFRHVGYALTGLLSLLVAYRVWRDPAPRTLYLGLAAVTLVAFTFLTTMHERYAYGAVVFLMLLIPDARARWLAIAFGAVFALNLVAAVPPGEDLGRLIPVSGILAVIASLIVLFLTLVATSWTRTAPRPA